MSLVLRCQTLLVACRSVSPRSSSAAQQRQAILSRAWTAKTHRDLHERLSIARETTDPEVLSVIAPEPREHADHDEALSLAVLANSACSTGLTQRFLTSPHVSVRLVAVEMPGLGESALLISAHDPDSRVAETARRRLREEIGVEL